MKSTIMEILAAYALATANGDTTGMVSQLTEMDSRLMSNKYVHPVYEPMVGDLVFFTNNTIGVMVGDVECIYYNKATDYVAKTVIVMDENTTTDVKMFGRVNTTKRSKTVIKQHIKHFSRYMQVRTTVTDAAMYHDVPVEIVRTIIYNESKFNDNAKSWTGVTGISMFTRATAKQFDVDKTSIESQLFGTSKVLRHHYNNLPNYYSEEERWKLSALIYSRGKAHYFKVKKALISRGEHPSLDLMLKGFKKYRYMNEGLVYLKRLEKNSVMFT